LSDALAAQVGGIGIAPGGNINYITGHAVFEATHGTAPKYANQDVVNPGSVILSGVMMLEYMGWQEAADLIVKGLESAIAAKENDLLVDCHHCRFTHPRTVVLGITYYISTDVEPNPAGSIDCALSLRPVEHDLSRVTRFHQFNRFLKFGVGEAVGDDRRNVEPALDHGRHFVPGFIHFPAVDSFDR